MQAYARVGNHDGALETITQGALIVQALVNDTAELVNIAMNEMYDSVR